jgi:hypothetical protein
MAAGMYTDPQQNPPPNRPRDARSIAEEAKQAASSVLSEQQHAAASGLGDFAGALRKAAREMGDGRQPTASRFAEYAADGLERVSGTLRNKDLNGLMQDVESFARRQPVAFLGAAIAAGFLAARFLKGSKQPGQRADETSSRPSDTGIPF